VTISGMGRAGRGSTAELRARQRLSHLKVAVAKYDGALLRMARVCLEVERSAEPRSYSHAYEALRRIVAEFYQL
jgi:hypothetical protein